MSGVRACKSDTNVAWLYDDDDDTISWRVNIPEMSYKNVVLMNSFEPSS